MPELNPENPYVVDPFYFINTTHVAYNQTMIAFLHKWNTYMSCFCGLCTCSMVVYLVLNKTPRYFKTYSRVILICTFVDFYFLIVESLAQFRFRVSGGALMFSLSGLFSMLNYWEQCKVISLYSASYAAAYLMLPFQYVYRYLTIKNKNPPSFLQLTGFFVFGIIVVILSLFSAHFGFCYENNYQRREYANLWYAEVPLPQVIYGLNTNPFFYVHAGGFTILSIFCYSSAIILARQTVMLLRRHALHMNRKTFLLQRQFGRVLFAQALAPLCCAIFPVLLAYTSVHLNSEIGYGSEYIIMSVSWFPFFNSITNILFISPYRNFCLQPLKKVKSLVSSQSVSAAATSAVYQIPVE